MSQTAPSPIYTLRGASGAFNTIHFSCRGGDSPLLFSGSAKGAIHMWNLNNRRAERIIEGHSGSSVLWVNTLHSADTLISQGRDTRVCLWNLSQGRSELMDSLSTGSVGFCQCSLLETGMKTCLLAFAGQQTEELKIVELPSKTLVCSLIPDSKVGMVMCVKLWQPQSGPGPLLLAGYEDGSLLLWDITQRSILSQTKVHLEPVMCLTFDPESLRGISASSENKLSSWMLDGQNNLQKPHAADVPHVDKCDMMLHVALSSIIDLLIFQWHILGILSPETPAPSGCGSPSMSGRPATERTKRRTYPDLCFLTRQNK
ncbi:guanine nucleotide-binding protein subunit beta-like protein 1 isoform X1 [Syngnathus acus]|uniref:guanine nucleotide-binding protein subunit beta-like protein 1 isoform X1 n=1 Tax=Syngnathus acus TaxID=161584 RepID=UPI001885C6B6|nr:guanine nucleotide-binding protein subunit beta-like protein 1 isoform X1 [Syngnathus acus]